MWFFYLFGIVIGLIINYFIAKKFAEIAKMKGHEGDTYFWFTFLLSVVGMLMVVALPVKNEKETHKNISSTVHITKESGPVITEKSDKAVSYESTITPKDPNKQNVPVSASIKDGEKVCPKCGTVQRVDRKVCWSCGQHFDN